MDNTGTPATAQALEIAAFGAVLKMIELPIQRVEQIDLWMKFGLLTSEDATLLTEEGYVLLNDGGAK